MRPVISRAHEPGREEGTDEPAFPPYFLLGKSSREARGQAGFAAVLLSMRQVRPAPTMGSLSLVAVAGRRATVSQALGVFCQAVRNRFCDCSRTLGLLSQAAQAAQVDRPKRRVDAQGVMVCDRGPLCREPDNSILSRQV